MEPWSTEEASSHLLENALITCEMNTISQVIADIRRYEPSLADALTGFTEKFKYTTILSAIQESQASPPSTNFQTT